MSEEQRQDILREIAYAGGSSDVKKDCSDEELIKAYWAAKALQDASMRRHIGGSA